MYSLAVIVPIYNEEKYLSKSLERLLSNDVFSEIFLVDDCSNDKSPRIAKEYVKNYEKINYYKTKTNSGKGRAVIEVIPFIKSSHTVIHDADLEYFPEDIVEMYELSKKNISSLILGSRFIGEKDRKNIYKRTFIANKVMSIFFSLINFYTVSDVATCYKLLPTSFLQSITLKENGFSFEIEILSKFLKFNKSVFEVPIKYEGRSYQEGKKIKSIDGFFYLFNTVRYRLFS